MSLVDPRRDSRPERPGRSEAAGADPTCRDVIALLLDYLEEALDPDTRAALARHFEDCAPCRAYRRTYDRSRQLVGDAIRNDAPDQPPEHLKERLRELLRRLRAERP